MRVEDEWKARQKQVVEASDVLISQIKAFENDLGVQVLRITVVRQRGKITELALKLSSKGHLLDTLPSEIAGRKIAKGNCSWCDRVINLDEGEICDCCSFFRDKTEMQAFASSHPDLTNEDNRLDYHKVKEVL